MFFRSVPGLGLTLQMVFVGGLKSIHISAKDIESQLLAFSSEER